MCWVALQGLGFRQQALPIGLIPPFQQLEAQGLLAAPLFSIYIRPQAIPVEQTDDAGEATFGGVDASIFPGYPSSTPW